MSPDAWGYAGDYGVPGILLLAFWIALITEKIVLGREKKAETERANRAESRERYWMELAISGTELAKTSMSLREAEQRRLP